MTLTVIPYSSSFGHTRLVAEHVAIGAGSIDGADVELIEITADDLQSDGRWENVDAMARMDAADAIILGTPTYMGSAHGLFKLFLENSFMPRWTHQQWNGKIAAGFTNSASPAGDKLVTLQELVIFAAQMGMIWVGVGDPPGGNRTDSTPDSVNRQGSWLGLTAQSPSVVEGYNVPGRASDGDVLTAERFGRRVATVAQRWALGADTIPLQPVTVDEARRRDQAGLEEWRRHND